MNRILTNNCFLGVVFTKPKGWAWLEIKNILEHAAQYKHAAFMM